MCLPLEIKNTTQIIQTKTCKSDINYIFIMFTETEENKDDDSEDDDLADLPFITALEASGQSRLTNEFEVLRSLGKGGFGDVIEVCK